MGGCSSKPKTADLEGVLGLEEEIVQEEDSRKNLEAENASWEGTERQQKIYTLPIQTHAIETNGLDETQDVSAVTHEKQMTKGFKEEAPTLQNDCQLVKHVLKETIKDLRVERELSSDLGLLKLQMAPKSLVTESSAGHDDPVLTIGFTENLQEDIPPALAAHDAETTNAQRELHTLSNGNLKNQDILSSFDVNSKNGGKGMFSDSNAASLQDARNVEQKSNCPQGRHLELFKDHLCSQGVETLELHKEPMNSGDSHSGLQEEASKREVEAEHHKTANENGEQRHEERVTSHEREKHIEEGIEECEASCKKLEVGACEVMTAASDNVPDLKSEKELVKSANDTALDLKSRKEVSKDLSKPMGEDIIIGEPCKEAGEDFIIDASNDTKRPLAEAFDQESPKEIANTDDVITVISQHVMYAKTKEQAVEVDATSRKSAERFVKIIAEQDRAAIKDKVEVKYVTPQAEADSYLVKGVPVKESSVESLDIVGGEDEFVWGKNCFNGKQPSRPVDVEESSHLKQKTSSKDAQENKPYAESFDVEGQQKSYSTSIPNGVIAIQVTTTPKKPEVQSVCEMKLAELVFIPAQDIPAPDIDEVLEKLASEFERQERVACATP